MYIKKILILLLIPVFFLNNFCSTKGKDTSPVIAQVGKSKLTLNDMNSQLPNSPMVKITRVQIEQLVRQWVENELIYQEALKSNLKSQPDFTKQLQQMRREFYIARYLDLKIDQSIRVDTTEIKQFYSENSDDFIRGEDLYYVRIILANSYSEANKLRTRIVTGEEFSEIAKAHSLDASKEQGGDLGWISLNNLSPTLAKKIPALKIKAVSSPIKSEVGYHLVQVMDKQNKGEIQTLEEVQDIIMMRLMSLKREQKYNNLVSTLGKQVDIKTDWLTIQKSLADSLLF